MKIVIADDDATSRMLLRSTLRQLGYEVVITCSGDEAWSVLQQPDAPELAILDWMMPGMNGPDICRKLRARSDGLYVYVILLTGLDRLNDLIEGMEAGADDYITKPFKVQELSVRLRAGRRILDLQRELLAAQRALEIRATHDSLTGLWNHAAILERLGEELHRGSRERISVGAILLDFDFFKRVNDAHGHAAGDQVLQESARRMVSEVRPYDWVGRYGGEEFLVVVPGCNVRGTAQVAERIRRAVSSVPVMISDGRLNVTVSCGVSTSTAGKPLEARVLVESADRALYRAKALGRNRVECLAAESDKPSRGSHIHAAH